MFSTFVYISFVLLLEVGHGVFSYLADEGVLMGRAVVVWKLCNLPIRPTASTAVLI